MKALCATIAVLVLAGEAEAQTFQTRDKIDLKVDFNLSVVHEAYKYSYLFSNGAAAQESVYVFDLRIPNNIVINDLNAPANWEQVLFANSPEVIRWIARADLAPGSSQDGFSFGSSNSLPGIVIYYSEGWAPAPVFDEGEATDSIPGYTDLTPYGPGVVGKTVGPVQPPDPFSATVFLDTLLSYARQSAELGWLAPAHSGRRIDWDDDCDSDEKPQDGVTWNIERRLTMAQRDLEREDSVKARRELQTLLRKVEQLWKRSQNEDKSKGHGRREGFRDKSERIIMTSEAYALLKYNLEYLIDRLPERERRHGWQKK